MRPIPDPIPRHKAPSAAKGKPRRIGLSGRTHAVMGHFGELFQGRLGPSGPVALLTLPCPVLEVTAEHRPGPFSLHQPWGRMLDPARARSFLTGLGLPVTGRFVLWAEMPVGGGAGASTAGLLALAHAAADRALCPDTLARACLLAEGASDPLMYPVPGRLLWASRRGEVLAHLPPLPRMEIIGGFHGPILRTDPADQRFPDISDLVAAWQRGGGAADLARLASASARACLQLRGPRDDPTEALAARLGALGFAIGHTGPARALLFPPGGLPDHAAGVLRAAGFTRITRWTIGG